MVTGLMTTGADQVSPSTQRFIFMREASGYNPQTFLPAALTDPETAFEQAFAAQDKATQNSPQEQ